MRILSPGPANCWLITSSDTGHNQSQYQILTLAHFSWQGLNPSQTLAYSAELNHKPFLVFSCVEVGATWRLKELLCVWEEAPFTSSNILKRILHFAVATKMREIPFLSIHTQICSFLAAFLFHHPISATVWSVTLSDSCICLTLNIKLTGSAVTERIIWLTSRFECVSFFWWTPRGEPLTGDHRHWWRVSLVQILAWSVHLCLFVPLVLLLSCL